MIRTKDLILFILILFFLGMAIIFTLSRNELSAIGRGFAQFSVSDPEVAYELGANADTKTTDRVSVIERMRQKIAEGGSVIEPVPSVETPEVVTDTATSTDSETSGEVTLTQCSTPDDSFTVARTWPLEDVSVEVREGARSVFKTESQTVLQMGTSTEGQSVSVVTKSLLQLPLYPSVSSDKRCVPGEVIGVTPSGSLIFNGDAVLYKNVSEAELIGYARDGFPIYGRYEGSVDACGGYMSPSGYRYSIGADRAFILGCFSAQPQFFVAS